MFKIVDIFFGTIIAMVVLGVIFMIIGDLEEPIKKRHKRNKEIKRFKQWSLSKRKACYSELVKINEGYKDFHSKLHSYDKQEAINAVFRRFKPIGVESDESVIKRKYGIDVDEKNIEDYIKILKKLM